MRSTGTHTLILATLIALLGTTPAAAQHRGGGRGGGGHGGGGYFGGGHLSGAGHHGGGYYGAGHYSYGWPYGGGWWRSPSVYVGPSYRYSTLPAFAIVDTDVSPEAAEVWLDGVYIGTADDFDGYPDYLYLKPGSYRLEFRYQGYETYSINLDARSGQKVNLDKDMPELASRGKAEPFDPARKPMPYGRLFEPGGKPASLAPPRREDGEEPRNNSVERQAEKTPLPPLAANQGSFRILALPDDAAVYLDDRLVGMAEELSANSRGVRAAAGPHTVTVARPGFKTKTLDVEAVAGKAVNVVVELEKQLRPHEENQIEQEGAKR